MEEINRTVLAIITHCFYISIPLFEGQKRFFKESFSENSGYDDAHTIHNLFLKFFIS